MPNLSTTAAKPLMADRVERLKTPKSNESEDGADAHQKVRAQAILLQELVTSFRASEDMRLLTAQRNRQLAEENKRLKDKIKLGSFESVTKKEVRSPTLLSPAEVSTLSMEPSSVASSSSTITLTKEQMSELAESVAALKEVAFRRENTWERMAKRQVALQRQIKTLKEGAVLTDRQLRDSAQTIKDQAAASKRDQSIIASLKKQVYKLNATQRVDKKSSVVEVMAPPARRLPRTTNAAEPRETLPGCRTPILHEATHVDFTGSRVSSRREHPHDKRDRYSDMGRVVDKAGHVVDKDGLHVEKAGHYAERMVHLSDRREQVAERRVVDHGSDRKPAEGATPQKQKRVVTVGKERRNS